MIGYIENTERSGLGSMVIPKDHFLGNISLEYSLMEVPSITLTLPISYTKHLTGSSHIVLSTDDWVYRGYVGDKTNNFKDMTVQVRTSHVIGRLDKRTLPTNVTVKARSVVSAVTQAMGYWSNEQHKDDLLNDFKITYLDDYAEKNLIEYEFSNETFLEFLTKVCEKTTSLYWRVSRIDPYLIEFGIFGEKRDILINEYNNLVSLDDVEENYEDTVNIAVAMSDKSDSGASSLTLRDIFHNPKLRLKGFPVIKTGNKVNSQRSYDYPQLPVFAPEIIGDEFAVMDEEGIALEAGELYWGTVTDNDTQSIAENNREITDSDRLKATEQLYRTAIRRLINSRRKVVYSITVEPLKPKSLAVGDRVMFTLNAGVWELTACTKYYEKILKLSDWFFVTHITDEYSEGDAHIQRLKLSKFLYSDRDITVNQ
jgi:hypothetical protein